MKPIFSRGPSLQIRIIIAVIFAIGFIVVDNRVDAFTKVRNYLDTAVSPFYFLANGPRQLLDGISDNFATRQQLEFENRALQQELLVKNSQNQLLEQFKQENARLRELLGSPLRQDEHMMVTQVMSGANTPYRDQVVIDKGSRDGVYNGQPVISDKGVVGQVIAVSQLTSRVLLICDTTHALPIQVLRNDIRVIASGTGCSDDLQLEPLPNNIDIRVGDVLVTSGLGGRFPEGYPVGIVSAVKVDNQRAYTIISAKPTADLQRLRYLLLLWGGDGNPRDPSGPSEVYRAANERIMQVMPQVVPPIMAPAPESTPDTAVPPAPAVQSAVQPKPASQPKPAAQPKPAQPKPAQPKPARPVQPAVPPDAQRTPDAAPAAPAETAPVRQLRMKPQ
ncbi:rod shape-determining protein MreC [Morganella psychrotolerans]|uniref:Cell shape-determining protein MreC n=1 Tax=Morganella psychrotolerans TaxID=368603 RepID=A0A1B8HP41_9GAMM|nr:rod shape-determining protein MreC [Morganella psychrotolerans]OBU11040.1 rod shape-determining protein MreC [Morganella psychrotolerans]